MKTSIHIMGFILSGAVLLIGIISIISGALIHHNDSNISLGGAGTVIGIIGLSALKAIWSENKHKHENAMHFRRQTK